MSHNGGDFLIYILQAVSVLLALIAVVISAMTFLRYDKWRRDDKTEITIRQVDQGARTGVDALGARFEARATKVDAALDAVTRKIEAEIDAIRSGMSVAESDLRNSLQKLDSRVKTELTSQGQLLAKLDERMQHSPTQADVSGLRETMAKLSGQVEANGARTDGVAKLLERIDASVQRIEEHHFR